jgi:hypothetical protein
MAERIVGIVPPIERRYIVAMLRTDLKVCPYRRGTVELRDSNLEQ